MSRTAQRSKEKQQSIIILRHECQSIQTISRTLKVSSGVTKTIKRYDETGSHEDHHRKGRPRVTSAAEDTFITCCPNRTRTSRFCSPTPEAIRTRRLKYLNQLYKFGVRMKSIKHLLI